MSLKRYTRIEVDDQLVVVDDEEGEDMLGDGDGTGRVFAFESRVPDSFLESVPFLLSDRSLEGLKELKRIRSVTLLLRGRANDWVGVMKVA